MSECRSCGASVRWVETERGKKMPLDADPVRPEDHLSRGLFVIRRLVIVTRSGSGEELGSASKDVALAAVDGTIVGDEPLYVSHFSTCPNADQWRRQR